MQKIAKFLLVILLLSAYLVEAQVIEVKRVHRYQEAPSVTTIYPCGSLQLITPGNLYNYNVAILVDSIYSTEKNYKLYAEFKQGLEYPLFELKLTNGDTLMLQADFIAPTFDQAQYIEAYLNPRMLGLIKRGYVVSIRVSHTYSYGGNEAFIETGQFFRDFIAKY